MVVTDKDIRERLKDIEEFMLQEYKESKPEKKRDWRTYEQQYARRIKGAIRNLEPLVDEAISVIRIDKGPGRPHELTLKQRVILLLMKELLERSNRPMANMLDLFSILSGIDISYKVVERLYSDEEVDMALHNLHVLILKKKGVKEVDATGDGTGYSVTVSRHYATAAQKEKDEAKEDGTQAEEKQKEDSTDQGQSMKGVGKKRGKHIFTMHTVNEVKYEFNRRKLIFATEELRKLEEDKSEIFVKDIKHRGYIVEKDNSQIDVYATRKGFVYSFRLMDLRTQMYVAYGTSLKSEKEAFEKAEVMWKGIEITLESVRLDRYYSCSVYVDKFGDKTKVYIMPKKNATLNGSWKWKRTMIGFVKNTPEHLKEYYRREMSEAGLSADKRMFGWMVAQRRADRIDCAQNCTAIWHNMLRLYPE